MSTDSQPDFNRKDHATRLGHGRRKDLDHPIWPWLDANGMTFEMFATSVKSTRTALGNYMAGRRPIHPDLVKRIADATRQTVTAEHWPKIKTL